MGKPANLSEEAYAVLQANKRDKKESLSQVILRHVPRPIRTFGDLEKHLESLDDCVFDRVDVAALRRARDKKQGARAH
jgi:predicted CopG family antitoxin